MFDFLALDNSTEFKPVGIFSSAHTNRLRNSIFLANFVYLTFAAADSKQSPTKDDFISDVKSARTKIAKYSHYF